MSGPMAAPWEDVRDLDTTDDPRDLFAQRCWLVLVLFEVMIGEGRMAVLANVHALE